MKYKVFVCTGDGSDNYDVSEEELIRFRNRVEKANPWFIWENKMYSMFTVTKIEWIKQ